MPNTKTGTTWAPDIRPENIETFTEAYTPEEGEEQTVTYKRVADHPILNDIRDKLAFFMTHAGAVWYNLQERRTLLDKLNETDAELREANAKIDDVKTASVRSEYLDSPGLIKFYRIGKTVYVSCYDAVKNLPKNQTVEAGSIPEGFEPISEFVTMAAPYNNIQFGLSGGKIFLYNYSGTDITSRVSFRVSGMYICSS